MECKFADKNWKGKDAKDNDIYIGDGVILLGFDGEVISRGWSLVDYCTVHRTVVVSNDAGEILFAEGLDKVVLDEQP